MGPCPLSASEKKVDCKVLPPCGKTIPWRAREKGPSLTSLGQCHTFLGKGHGGPFSPLIPWKTKVKAECLPGGFEVRTHQADLGRCPNPSTAKFSFQEIETFERPLGAVLHLPWGEEERGPLVRLFPQDGSTHFFYSLHHYSKTGHNRDARLSRGGGPGVWEDGSCSCQPLSPQTDRRTRSE